ncbi:hypothetical protein HELRODRAFT_181788 [Helobdella robusta]|uniref:Uncharacterized protein n=1 Tax=Helobdella robusta TaxID=6412 RepID=T1FHB8_HELRO|nr:hypothetical protein HELRODRAFT_181788 [Helobdella robusta]ESN92164.1 hypothetical protein HELRODRAFT_181788 [Helobdella robusta]
MLRDNLISNRSTKLRNKFKLLKEKNSMLSIFRRRRQCYYNHNTPTFSNRQSHSLKNQNQKSNECDTCSKYSNSKFSNFTSNFNSSVNSNTDLSTSDSFRTASLIELTQSIDGILSEAKEGVGDSEITVLVRQQKLLEQKKRNLVNELISLRTSHDSTNMSCRNGVVCFGTFDPVISKNRKRIKRARRGKKKRNRKGRRNRKKKFRKKSFNRFKKSQSKISTINSLQHSKSTIGSEEITIGSQISTLNFHKPSPTINNVPIFRPQLELPPQQKITRNLIPRTPAPPRMMAPGRPTPPRRPPTPSRMMTTPNIEEQNSTNVCFVPVQPASRAACFNTADGPFTIVTVPDVPTQKQVGPQFYQFSRKNDSFGPVNGLKSFSEATKESTGEDMQLSNKLLGPFQSVDLIKFETICKSDLSLEGATGCSHFVEKEKERLRKVMYLKDAFSHKEQVIRKKILILRKHIKKLRRKIATCKKEMRIKTKLNKAWNEKRKELLKQQLEEKQGILERHRKDKLQLLVNMDTQSKKPRSRMRRKQPSYKRFLRSRSRISFFENKSERQFSSRLSDYLVRKGKSVKCSKKVEKMLLMDFCNCLLQPEPVELRRKPSRRKRSRIKERVQSAYSIPRLRASSIRKIAAKISKEVITKAENSSKTPNWEVGLKVETIKSGSTRVDDQILRQQKTGSVKEMAKAIEEKLKYKNSVYKTKKFDKIEEKSESKLLSSQSENNKNSTKEQSKHTKEQQKKEKKDSKKLENDKKEEKCKKKKLLVGQEKQHGLQSSYMDELKDRISKIKTTGKETTTTTSTTTTSETITETKKLTTSAAVADKDKHRTTTKVESEKSKKTASASKTDKNKTTDSKRKTDNSEMTASEQKSENKNATTAELKSEKNKAAEPEMKTERSKKTSSASKRQKMETTDSEMKTVITDSKTEKNKAAESELKSEKSKAESSGKSKLMTSESKTKKNETAKTMATATKTSSASSLSPSSSTSISSSTSATDDAPPMPTITTQPPAFTNNEPTKSSEYFIPDKHSSNLSVSTSKDNAMKGTTTEGTRSDVSDNLKTDSKSTTTIQPSSNAIKITKNVTNSAFTGPHDTESLSRIDSNNVENFVADIRSDSTSSEQLKFSTPNNGPTLSNSNNRGMHYSRLSKNSNIRRIGVGQNSRTETNFSEVLNRNELYYNRNHDSCYGKNRHCNESEENNNYKIKYKNIYENYNNNNYANYVGDATKKCDNSCNEYIRDEVFDEPIGVAYPVFSKYVTLKSTLGKFKRKIHYKLSNH